MIAHYDIVQGTEEWFKIKWGKVGGTLAKGLFVKSDTLLLDILAECTEEFHLDDGYQSEDMLRGHELEPIARKALSEYTGIEFIECGWLQSETIPILGISPDGISKDETISAELKCLTSKMHIKTILGDCIPKEYIHQCLHYFTVNPKLQKHYFCSFRPEAIKELFVKELTRDTLVDLGFTKKGKVREDRGHGMKDYVCTLPDLRTVQQWVDLAEVEAINLQKQIKESIDKLKF